MGGATPPPGHSAPARRCVSPTTPARISPPSGSSTAAGSCTPGSGLTATTGTGASRGSRRADAVPTGLELVTMDLSAPIPVLDTLPGTDQASSVAVAGSDTVYYTRNGDARVFRLVLSTGATTVAHDFGGPIARDVQVAGTRLVAVVGGAVSFSYDSNLQPVQRDGGGVLHLVDLTSGMDVTLTDAALAFRHPALAPSGTQLVAELVTGRTTDLWAVSLP